MRGCNEGSERDLHIQNANLRSGSASPLSSVSYWTWPVAPSVTRQKVGHPFHRRKIHGYHVAPSGRNLHISSERGGGGVLPATLNLGAFQSHEAFTWHSLPRGRITCTRGFPELFSESVSGYNQAWHGSSPASTWTLFSLLSSSATTLPSGVSP